MIVGDSIAEGLGVRGHCYADLLRETTDRSFEVINLAGTGKSLAETTTEVEQIVQTRPDTVVIAHGSFETLFRPVGMAHRMIPPRWRRKGWLDPRPYFSKRLIKGIYQRTESAIRWRYKVFLVRYVAGESWSNVDQFAADLRKLIDELVATTSAQILVVPPATIDEKYYPGSPALMAAFTKRTKEICSEKELTGRVRCCDLSSRLSEWSDYFADHFHPNASGHQKIATAIREAIRV